MLLTYLNPVKVKYLGAGGLAKHNVLAIEPRRLRGAEEELRTVRAGARVGLLVLELVLALELDPLVCCCRRVAKRFGSFKSRSA